MSSEVEDLERAKRKLLKLNCLVDAESSAKKFKMDNVSMSEIRVNIQDPESSNSCSTPVSSLCSPVIIKKDPVNLKQWLDMFSEWSNSERFAALDALVTTDMCEVQQMRHLLSLIEPQLQRDFISLLPKELALHVLSYLSPQDLLNASQTCRAWRILCEDNLLWREKCTEEGLLRDVDAFWGVENKNAPKPSPSPVVVVEKPHIDDDNVDGEYYDEDLFEYSEYKLGYLRSKSVEFNWRNGVINYTPDEENLTPGNPAGRAASGNNGQQAQAQSQAPAQNPFANASSANPYDARKPQNGGALSRKLRELRKVLQLKGHEEHVITCLQFNPHSNLIVSGSDDNTLRVWSSQTGKCIRTLSGHTGGVWSSQLAPDNIVISGSTDRSLRVWCAMSGVCKHILYGHTSTVRCMSLHGKTVISGSRDATLRVWNIDTGSCEHVLVGHLAAVRCVQFNGKVCVSGAYDYMVKVWDVANETCLHTLEGHSNRVYSLQFDGHYIVSGSLDTSIRVWNAQTGELKHTLIGHQSLTSGMQLRGNILVSGNADSTVKVWDINTGKCLQTLSGVNKHQSAVTCLQFNANFVITSSDDGTVKLWDLKTGEFIRNLISLPSGGSGGVVWRIRASNTKLVCAVGSRNGTEETKLLVLDFENPNMFFDNYAPEVRKTLKRLHPLSHPTPGHSTRFIESLNERIMPTLARTPNQESNTPIAMEVISTDDTDKKSLDLQPIAGASGPNLIECYLESSEPNLAYIQVVDQNEDSLQHFQQQQEPGSSKNQRRKHEENKDSDNGSPAKKQARSDEVKTPEGEDGSILPGPSSSSSSSSSSTVRQVPKSEAVDGDSD